MAAPLWPDGTGGLPIGVPLIAAPTDDDRAIFLAARGQLDRVELGRPVRLGPGRVADVEVAEAADPGEFLESLLRLADRVRGVRILLAVSAERNSWCWRRVRRSMVPCVTRSVFGPASRQGPSMLRECICI